MARRKRSEKKPGPGFARLTRRSKIGVIVAPGIGIVCGTGGLVKHVRVNHSDRVANGEAFPGERVQRVKEETYVQVCRGRGWFVQPSHYRGRSARKGE